MSDVTYFDIEVVRIDPREQLMGGVQRHTERITGDRYDAMDAAGEVACKVTERRVLEQSNVSQTYSSGMFAQSCAYVFNGQIVGFANITEVEAE